MGRQLGPFHLVVTCEHASNAVPEGVTLGVPRGVLESHVAWDPGAQEIAQALADAFDAPLVLGEQSRLVADLNRAATGPASVPSVAFGVPVPGNAGLTPDDRRARLAAHHRPYWSRVRDAIHAGLVGHGMVLHLSVHTFTPEVDTGPRPMSAAVMFDPAHQEEGAVGRRLLAWLPPRGLSASENEPFDGRDDVLVAAFRAALPPSRYLGIQLEVSHRHLDELDRVGALLVDGVRAAVGP